MGVLACSAPCDTAPTIAPFCGTRLDHLTAVVTEQKGLTRGLVLFLATWETHRVMGQSVHVETETRMRILLLLHHALV
jgi:hypothetical protein